MKIAIFETEHFEAVYPLIRLFDQTGNQLFLYVYPETERQLRQMSHIPESAIWMVKAADEPKRAFITRMQDDLLKLRPDILWLGTVSNNFYFYARMISVVKPRRTILTAHAINQLFYTKQLWKPRRLFRAIGKAMLLGRLHGINVLAETLLAPLRQKTGERIKAYAIAGGLSTEHEAKSITLQSGDELRFVIPGTVDIRRRDYRQLISMAQRLEVAGIRARFILAGKISGSFGEDILEKLTNWAQYFTHTSFKWNVDGLSQSDFDEALRSAHFILCPQQRSIVVDDSITEYYGRTISSGNLGDMISSGKPLIVPDYIAIDKPLAEAVLRYRDLDHFLEIIEASLQPGAYAALAARTIAALSHHQVNAVRQRYPDLFT